MLGVCVVGGGTKLCSNMNMLVLCVQMFSTFPGYK